MDVKEELDKKVNTNAKNWIKSNTPESLRTNKELLDFLLKTYVEGANDPDLIDYIEKLCDLYRKLKSQYDELYTICKESISQNDYLIQRVECQNDSIKKQKDELDNYKGFVDDVKTYIL